MRSAANKDEKSIESNVYLCYTVDIHDIIMISSAYKTGRYFSFSHRRTVRITGSADTGGTDDTRKPQRARKAPVPHRGT